MRGKGVIIGAALAAGAVAAVSYACFRMAFYSSPKKRAKKLAERSLPQGECFDAHKKEMYRWIDELKQLPHRSLELTSRDGLKLCGRYYEYEPGAPIEILHHGYRGDGERDLSGAVFRCHALCRSALIVDMRASGASEGSVITFGVKESLDCADWVALVLREIDPNARIIISGISMGASTVLMASGLDLPENVVGCVADCGYSSAKAIIKKVIRDRHLPPALAYPFVRLGGIIYGGFDVEERPPVESVKKSSVPTVFIHGDADAFVPYRMSVENYDACSAEKRLVSIEGAEHGMCFLHNREEYFRVLREFFDPILQERK